MLAIPQVDFPLRFQLTDVTPRMPFAYPQVTCDIFDGHGVFALQDAQ
jgi:hypothetical protein